jgi:hypothetical protein
MTLTMKNYIWGGGILRCVVGSNFTKILETSTDSIFEVKSKAIHVRGRGGP